MEVLSFTFADKFGWTLKDLGYLGLVLFILGFV